MISENGMVHQFHLFPVHIFPKPMEFSPGCSMAFPPLGPQTVQEVYPKLVLEDLGKPRPDVHATQISFIGTVIVRK